jgi:uncharacterized protein YbjT (DUF2867 family)
MTSAARTTLVTGATGTVGRHVVQRLREKGAPVVAAGRDPQRARELLGVPAVRFDFEQPETYAEAFQGIEKLFLVRPPAITRVWQSIFPALEAARRAGVQHVVLLSLLGAEQNPLVPHRWIEWKLQAMDIAWTFLRPSFFMQNLATTHRADVQERDMIYVPAGHGRTSFIDARDVAAVGASVLVEDGHAGKAYALTGSEALTYSEVAAILTDVLGRPIYYADPSPWAFALHMRRQGHPWPFILVMTGIYLTARFGLADRVTGDLHHVLGREPTSVHQFAIDYADRWEASQ